MRILTYNVHSCAGTDGRRSIKRIAEVIAPAEPDVVALQELDAHRPRSDRHRQAEAIAEALGMRYHFHPAFQVQDEQYGDALLTHHPMELVKAGALPEAWSPIWNEKRGSILARITCGGRIWNILNTHLGLGSKERMLQAQTLVGPEWRGLVPRHEPFVLCGDFNSVTFRRTHGFLCTKLRDAQLDQNPGRPEYTFPGRRPMICLDYIFVNEHVRVKGTQVLKSALARKASDHLPLMADLEAV
jgi:endonuclease/exonuclease/phosphatase family metal-dependent hydrolase